MTTPATNRPQAWTRAAILLGVLGIFGGQAWLFHRGQAPVMALLQNEELVRTLVEQRFGVSWDTWVSDPGIHRRIVTGMQVVSWFFGLCALCSIGLLGVRGDRRRSALLRRALSGLILSGVGALVVLAWLSYLDHNEVAFHYLEYSTQVVTPLMCVVMLAGSFPPGRWLGWVARIALALTFTVHGLYAIGLEIPGSSSMTWTLPGSWVEMTVNGLGKAGAIFGLAPPSEDTAAGLLYHIGVLDLLAAVGVLLPWAKVKNACLLYMATWGLLTALARTWSHFHPEFASETLAQWIPETLIRLPHFALPIVLLGVSFRPAPTSSSDHPSPS